MRAWVIWFSLPTFLVLFAERAFSDIAGTVIDHVPAATKTYVGSPSIVIMPDGSYVASHDYFGPGTRNDTTVVFASKDRGETWRRRSVIKGQWWSSLFIYQNQLYLIGVSKEFGHIVIRRSTDGGATWTSPADSTSGRLTSAAHFHCAPTPVIEFNGRIWRAFESSEKTADGGKSFQAFIISAAVGADLLIAANWKFSNPVPGNTNWLGGKFDGWLEGNAVVDRHDRLLDVLRVRFTAGEEKAALVQISPDGSSATFDPAAGFVDFPGGAKKFTVRFDPQLQLYWTLANTVPEPKPPGRIDLIRNTLALASSPDLTQWTVRSIILHHPDTKTHGFQYADWQFDGDDLIAAVRTAADEVIGGAHSAHDANYLTFYRIERFRDLKRNLMADNSLTIENTRDFSVSGGGFTIETINNGSIAFANRKYVWGEVPENIRGWRYTRTSGGQQPRITIRSNRDATVHIITCIDQPGVDLAGWEPTGQKFYYTDDRRSRMAVFQRKFVSGETISLPQGNWSGVLLLLPNQSK